MSSQEVKPGVYQYEAPEEIRLHRGISETTLDTANKRAGIHWTPEHQIAENFAVYRHPDGNTGFSPHGSGVVYSADVHPKHVLENDPDKEFVNYVRGQNGIFSPNHEEKEHTLIWTGTPLRNLSAVQYDQGKIAKARFIGETTRDGSK